MFPMQCKNLLDFLLSISLPLLLSSAVIASELENEQLNFSGFATLGAVLSDSDHHGYRKDIGSDEGVYADEIGFKQHSLLGLQADWNISPSFDAVYQAVLRDLPNPSFDRYTTLAFLRYELNTNWSIRFGRTAPDLFLLTEYRDVDFAYIWATAPNEVYGIIPFRSIDGIDISHSKRLFGGVFKSKVFTGVGETEIASSEVVETLGFEDLLGLSLSFEHFNWLVKVKYTQSKIANEPASNTLLTEVISQLPDTLWPNSDGFSQALRVKGKAVQYASVSGQYQWQNWLASAELAQITSEAKAIPKLTSGYAALSHQINAHQFYGIYAFTESNNYFFNEVGVNEALLEELIDASVKALNFYAANQQTLSIGWRWDINSYMATSLQWNHSRIEEHSNTLWLDRPGQHGDKEKINVLLLTLNLVF